MAYASLHVSLSRFGLDITAQNKILVQFHNYCVLAKVQWRLLVVSRVFKNLALVTAGKF